MRVIALSLIAACSVAVASQAALAQMQRAPQTFIAGSGPDDLWDVTTQMEMSGMQMPGRTSQICIRKGRNVGEGAVQKRDNCRVTEMNTAGNKTTFAMECTGDDPMTVRGETTATPTSFDQRMAMNGTRKGNEMQMNMTASGRKVGACTDQSEQFVANAKAQGQAELAKVCTDAADKFQYTVFGQGQACEGNRKVLCDKVSGLAPGMMKPAGFRAAVEKPGIENVRGAFDGCKAPGVDFTTTARAACGDAVATRDWGFLGIGACDVEVMAQAPGKCVGRDYYTVDKTLVPMCNRYAMLSRGGSAATAAGAASAQSTQAMQPAQPMQPTQPTQPAQAEAQKADPVKQGLDAVRKLLPF